MKDIVSKCLESNIENAIYPFLWMHGEDHSILLEELQKIYDSSIGGICVEARPHPDFAGPQWWADMDLVMSFAKAHSMKVWLLDDDHFPTGHANGAFKDGTSDLSNLFLTWTCADQSRAPLCRLPLLCLMARSSLAPSLQDAIAARIVR